MNRISSREEELFANVLAQPEERRADFLDTACGTDATLRARIEALLAAHADPDPLLDPILLSRGAGAPDERPGDWLGRYKLLQKIGEGGCGVVWMAEQEEPVRRRVALKVIKAGMDTREVIARFAAERQALAMMDHAGIAKVLDAGATGAGRPFFVMELVRGVRITQFCDEHSLSPAARLELFVQVCQAVQHAHQKGVIHRDLKPSNILVTLPEGGGSGVVKVIDFGIAKATQGRLVDGTLVTAFEQFIGTPVYMSPEQADTSGLDIDTRSDVYSLGILLYELLVGGPPFDPRSLNSRGRDEIRRLIREEEPPRPSVRFARLDLVERAKIAQWRGTDPLRLTELLKGDLDWIVMKAIEKDRTRRYQTAMGLAVDIERHLRDEPVMARPPSAAYRVGKLIRRNRLAVAGVALLAFTLIAATLVSTWLAVRAVRAEQVADAARRRVVEAQVRAEKLIAFMIGDLRAQLAKVGRLDVLESAANESLGYFAALDASTVDDATLTRHAMALMQIGELRMEQARYSDAQAAFGAAHDRAAMLAERNPTDPDVLYARSTAEYWNGFVHWRRGEFPAAREWIMRQQRTTSALIAMQPDNSRWQRQRADVMHSLAALDVEQGQLPRAKESFLAELGILEQLLEAAPDELELRQQRASVISFLGTIAERSGELSEAERRYVEQARELEAVRRADPNLPAVWLRIAENLTLNQAEIFAITADLVRAQAALTQAREILEPMVRRDPANHRWMLMLFTARLKESVVARAAGRVERAEELVAATRQAFEQLKAWEPTDRRSTVRLALAWRLEAEWRHAAGAASAHEAASRAVELGENAISRGRADHAEIAEFAQACIVAGRIAWTRDPAAARRHWERADELLAPRAAGSRDWRLLDPAARLAVLLGRDAEAQALVGQLRHIGYVPLQPWPEPPHAL